VGDCPLHRGKGTAHFNRGIAPNESRNATHG